MRQGLDKYSHRNGTVIKHKKDDFRVPELRFPNFRICDFEPQEYSIFGDAAITSAIVDRLTYKAYLIDMEGDFYRLRETLRHNGTDFETVVK